MRKKKQKKNESGMFIYAKPSIFNKIWFWLTAWRPITKYEYNNLKNQLLIILEGMRESDLQHYTTERQIIEEIKKVIEKNGTSEYKDRNKDNDDKMFG